MFFKIGVLKNFAILTGKHLCWSRFLIKFQLQLYQEETPTRFPVKITEFLRSAFFITPPVAAYGSSLKPDKRYKYKTCKADDKTCNYCFVSNETEHLARNCPRRGNEVRLKN